MLSIGQVVRRANRRQVGPVDGAPARPRLGWLCRPGEEDVLGTLDATAQVNEIAGQTIGEVPNRLRPVAGLEQQPG